MHNGAESLLLELEQSLAPHQTIRLLEDINSGVIDREDAVELAEFVYEAVVDNFERFLEYNTTTTYSDYGNRLYCLLDFVRLESLYDRFDWNTVPWQIAHETMVRNGNTDLATVVEEFLADETREIAGSFVAELESLEAEYGVRLPTLHDHISEKIVGSLVQNRMTALISECVPDADLTEQDAESRFRQLRGEIAAYMQSRIGSGIEPPEWMQRLANEVERIQDGKSAWVTESLYEGDFIQMTQKIVDKQLTSIARRSDGGQLKF